MKRRCPNAPQFVALGFTGNSGYQSIIFDSTFRKIAWKWKQNVFGPKDNLHQVNAFGKQKQKGSIVINRHAKWLLISGVPRLCTAGIHFVFRLERHGKNRSDVPVLTWRIHWSLQPVNRQESAKLQTGGTNQQSKRISHLRRVQVRFKWRV